jgi:opacity protein-like surface antigen
MLGNLKLIFVLAVGLALQLSLVHAAQEVTIDDEDMAVVNSVSDVIPPRGRKIGFKNKNGDTVAIVTARESRNATYVPKQGLSATISPTVGMSGIAGSHQDEMTNKLTAGFALDVPITQKFSAELEGLYSINQIQRHDVEALSFGANGKYYFSRKFFSPYVGAGIAALCYQNLSMGAVNPTGRYNEWIGAGQLLAGVDFNISSKVSIGVRGSGVMPLFSRPDVPSSVEAAVVDSFLYRAMGSVRFAL